MKLSNSFIIFLSVNLNIINKKIPNINSGGCGIFAIALYKRLKKAGLNPKLISIHRSKDKLEIGNNAIVQGNSKDYLHKSEFHHLVVKLDGYYLDSRGLKKPSELADDDYLSIEVDPCFLETCIKDRSGWNPTFNRTYAKDIQNRINDLQVERQLL